jgi:thiamine-monophosphate kinase
VYEDKITKQLKSIFTSTLTDEVLVGIGDDCAVIRQKQDLVISTDILVQDVHFKLEWSSACDIAYRAFAQNLADVAAMGGRGVAMVVAIGLPLELESQWLLDFANAFKNVAEKNSVAVIGGDLSKSSALTIAVTVLGSLDGREPVTRSGAKVGDKVAVCGKIGSSAIGFKKLKSGLVNTQIDDQNITDFLYPTPNYAQGIWASENGARAMIDTSDGLFKDASRIAKASGVTIKLFSAEESVPKQEYYFGGEDHALLACFPPDVELNNSWNVIGEVIEQGENEVEAIDLLDDDLSNAFDHFGGGIYV